MDASTRVVRRFLSVGLLALALGGCGGGGDGGGGGPPGSFDLSVANQDAVSRAAAVAVQGGIAADSLGLAVDGGGVLGAGSRRLAARLDGRITATRAAVALVGREQPAAVGFPPEACLVSGSTTETDDDRDGDGQIDVGESITIVFDDCSDVAGEVVSGAMTATFTALRAAGFTAQVDLTAFRTTWPGHFSQYDGGFSLAFDVRSSTAATTGIGVGNQLVAQVTTPSYSDTFTLRAGYAVESTVDAAVGRNTTTASGSVSSAVAGGYVTVRTVEPVIQHATDAFPRAGRIEALGRNGSLVVNVLSATEVRVDLDSDGNGAYEVSEILPWDWLL